ncbi:hypothetical protein DCS_05969 [Drechmeria coniospora]|uniref:Uncharacterized protein n=1 Tax=Drechmeria coniospora TaxID=98403 RepID=A0A151GAA5_DRECN|nr:hypothetical protein DCS_05969 [Drechmeria coniospora]KYK54019.1 hypothetical protein DCS_05969 [Drechmeria coniospora]
MQSLTLTLAFLLSANAAPRAQYTSTTPDLITKNGNNIDNDRYLHRLEARDEVDDMLQTLPEAISENENVSDEVNKWSESYGLQCAFSESSLSDLTCKLSDNESFEHRINYLAVGIKLSDDFWSATSGNISAFFPNLFETALINKMVELLNAPSREASKTVPVDLKRVFGSETISLSQVQKLSLYVSKDADAFKVESLTVTARLQNSPDSGIILKNTKYATLNTRFSDDTHHQFNEDERRSRQESPTLGIVTFHLSNVFIQDGQRPVAEI